MCHICNEAKTFMNLCRFKCHKHTDEEVALLAWSYPGNKFKINYTCPWRKVNPLTCLFAKTVQMGKNGQQFAVPSPSTVPSKLQPVTVLYVTNFSLFTHDR